MQIYDVLKNDHDAVKPLLDELLTLIDAAVPDKMALAHHLRAELNAHHRAEEAVFYNSLRDLQEGAELVEKRYQEHAAADALLHLLSSPETLHLEWQEGVYALTDALEEHIADEESRIFTAARRLIQPEEAEMMAQAFLSLKQELAGEEEAWESDLAAMVADQMPERFRVPTNHI